VKARFWTTVLAASSSLLLAQGAADNARDMGGDGRLGGITISAVSTLNNLGVLLCGFLVGTLLVCIFDPDAKKFIRRAVKSLL
jgi:hypothetical protein